MIPSSNKKVLEIDVYIQYMWSIVCPMVLHLALLKSKKMIKTWDRLLQHITSHTQTTKLFLF